MPVSNQNNSNFLPAIPADPIKACSQEDPAINANKASFIDQGEMNISKVVQNVILETSLHHQIPTNKKPIPSNSPPAQTPNRNQCVENVQSVLLQSNSSLLPKDQVNSGPHQSLGQRASEQHSFVVGARNVTDVIVAKCASKAKQEIAMQRAHPKELTKGAIKQIWSDGKDAYATPIKNISEIFNSNTNELKKELKNVNKIKFNLFTLDLNELLITSNKFSEDNKADKIAKHVVAHFGTMKEFVDYLADKDPLVIAQGLMIKFNERPGPGLHHPEDKGDLVTPKEVDKLLEIFKGNEFQPDIARMYRSGENIQLDMKEAGQNDAIYYNINNKTFALKMDLASGDLTKLIQDPKFAELPFEDVLDICAQVSNAIKDLHRAGFIHADLKPENFLFYEDPLSKKIKVKLSDFGKATEIKPDDYTTYHGNRKCGPPESKISMLGETYCGGAIMIRILEEWVIKKEKNNENEETMLIQPTNISDWARKDLSPDRRGFEKYICLSADCPQKELWPRRIQLLSGETTPSEKLETAEIAVSYYIEELARRLKSKTPQAESQVEILAALLKKMMQSKKIENRPRVATVTTQLSKLKESVNNPPF